MTIIKNEESIVQCYTSSHDPRGDQRKTGLRTNQMVVVVTADGTMMASVDRRGMCTNQ
jgi:uncharacterized membrane protein YhiD involved in acid resistance